MLRWLPLVAVLLWPSAAIATPLLDVQISADGGPAVSLITTPNPLLLARFSLDVGVVTDADVGTIDFGYSFGSFGGLGIFPTVPLIPSPTPLTYLFHLPSVPLPGPTSIVWTFPNGVCCRAELDARVHPFITGDEPGVLPTYTYRLQNPDLVPEPLSLILLVTGLAGAGWMRRRR